jgi:hypothetical protein
MFEDRLLTELMNDDAWGERQVPQEVVPPRPIRRSRMMWGAMATVTAAAAVAVVVVAGPSSTPAYAVTKNADGTVTLSLHELAMKPAEQKKLAAKLRGAGVNMIVDTLPAGKTCADGRGRSADVKWEDSDDRRDMRAVLAPGDTLAMTYSGPERMNYVASLFTGPVAKCQPVDDGVTTSEIPMSKLHIEGPGHVQSPARPVAPR